jgi:DtxR family Mn-dependent transcriptional regulator
MLTDLLGIPWERVHDIACRFEHVIDEEVEAYLTEALNHPDTCPHGNPLDVGAKDRWQSLASLSPGESGYLRCVVDGTEPALDYLTQIRLGPAYR